MLIYGFSLEEIVVKIMGDGEHRIQIVMEGIGVGRRGGILKARHVLLSLSLFHRGGNVSGRFLAVFHPVDP